MTSPINPDHVGAGVGSQKPLDLTSNEEAGFGTMMGIDSLYEITKYYVEDFPDLEFASQPQLPKQQEQENQGAICNAAIHNESRLDPSLGLLTPELSISPREFVLCEINEMPTFDQALRLCSDLNQQILAHKDDRSSGRDNKEALRLVESICCTARVTGSASDHATTALILAAICKVLEMCDIFVQKASRGVYVRGSETLGWLLLLKRLDLSLFQAKMFLDHISNSESAEKALLIHQGIESIINQQQYQSIW